MKPLNKAERWYAFLQIVFAGDNRDLLPFNHIDFGFMSECEIRAARSDEIDDLIETMWDNPPKVKYV